MAAGEEILVVEDDRKTAALITTYLEREGFRTIATHDGAEGLALARSRRPDLVILDLMLPSLDGFEVCRELRKHSGVPVLILSARSDEVDRIVGFRLGADDYVVKPFSPGELVERVKAILRRAANPPATTPEILCHGDLSLDPGRHRAALHGAPLTLTPSEFLLLQLLMGSPGQVFTRGQLLDHLHQDGTVVVERVVDVHVGNLRQKIEEDPAAPRYVLTVRGVGYRFADD